MSRSHDSEDPVPPVPRQLRPPAGDNPVVRAMSRSALLWALPVALLTAAVCWALRGPAGGVAAGIGGAIAVLAFVSGTWGVGRLLDHLPGAEVPGALALYLTQLLLLVALVLLVREQDWLDARAAAVGLFATALAYQIGQVGGFLRARTLLVDTRLPHDRLP